MSLDIDDIISRMRPKKPEKTDDDFKASIKKRGLCFYSILGVPTKATKLEIKRAYQQKLVAYHPDKAEKTPENLAKYKLIREAGETLMDDHKRKAYDMEQNVSMMPTDFISQKESFKEFTKLQEPETKQDEQQRKQYLKPEPEEKLMTQEEHARRYEDTVMQREMEDVETTHTNLFEGRQFNMNEFNKIFEKKKKKNSKSKAIVKFEDITAYYDGGDLGSAFETDAGCNPFGQCNETFAELDKTHQEDTVSIDSLEDDDAGDPVETKKVDDQDIEKLMAERKSADLAFESMVDADFKSAINDKFGVSNGMGFMVGTHMFGSQPRKANVKIDDDAIKAYKALLEK